MNHLRRVAVPAYFVAAIIIVFTALDLVEGILPVHPSDARWRVLSIALLSRRLLLPLVGLVLAYGSALLLGQARTLRALAALDAVVALVLAIGVAFYMLDSVTVRARLDDAGRLGVLISLAKFGFGFAMLALLAFSQWRAAGAVERADRQHADEGSLVFHPGSKGPAPPPSTSRWSRAVRLPTRGKPAEKGGGSTGPPSDRGLIDRW